MFDTMNRICTGCVNAASCSANRALPTASAIRITKKAISHGVARRTPSSATAASGTMTDHSTMPLDATKPPSVICSNAGSSSHIVSWVVRKTANRFVRASTSNPTSAAT